MKIVGLLVFITILGIIGIVWLFFSRGFQRFMLRWVDRVITSKIPIVKRFIQAEGYLVHLKIMGVLAILCAAFLLWAFIHAYLAW
jgi:type II secretory pathway component PulF